MIRWVVKIGRWLDRRFPEKVVVTKADFDALLDDIAGLCAERAKVERVEELLKRVEFLEKNTVHVEAVKEFAKILQGCKDEIEKIKLTFGLKQMEMQTAGPEADGEAVYNGVRL